MGNQFLDTHEFLAEPAAAGGGAGTPYASTPEKQGTGAAGSSDDYARGDHVHPFRSRYLIPVGVITNLAANTTTAANAASVLPVVVPRAGKVTHIICDGNFGVVTAGSYQVQVIVITGLATTGTAYSAAGEILTMTSADTDSRKVTALADPISISAGDVLAFRCVSTADLAPTTIDPRVYLMFEED